MNHAEIAGALFDFMGWLTSREKRLVLSSTDNASPAVAAIMEFAEMRGLNLDEANVKDWNKKPELPQHDASRRELPLHMRSVPGFVVPVREVNIDVVHLRGARAE
jgi:hypothetical protein